LDVLSLGFRTDLMLRRLAGSEVDDRGDLIVVRTPQNPGFYWGNFLLVPGPVAAADADRWLTTFATEFPDAQHVAIGVDGVDGEAGARDAFEAAGLTCAGSTVLVATELNPPFRRAGDVVLRPLQSDADWAGSVTLRAALDERDDEFHAQFLERRMAELRSWVADGHGVYVGAFAEDRVVATLGLFTDGAGLGRFQNVETHPDFRRRGLAAGLLELAARLASERFGVRRMVIVADPDYVAIDLYKRMGFIAAEQQVQWEREPTR
jgi:ribosomal protein S18 acetylase RimI-like enzyme